MANKQATQFLTRGALALTIGVASAFIFNEKWPASPLSDMEFGAHLPNLSAKVHSLLDNVHVFWQSDKPEPTAADEAVEMAARPDEPLPENTAHAPQSLRSDRAKSPATSSDRALDMTGLDEALALYRKGDLSGGDTLAETHVKEGVIRTALQWIALQMFPQSGFTRLQKFARNHPQWPAQDWLRKRSEETLYGERSLSPEERTFLLETQPTTAAGKIALARLLIDENKGEEAAKIIRQVWRESDFPQAMEAKIRSEFGSLLEKADYKYRVERLLYKERGAEAMRLAPLAGPDVVSLVRLQIASFKGIPNDKLFAAVPANLQKDPAYLFARIRKARRSDKILEAATLLLSAPRDPSLIVNGDEWWVERRLIARKLLDQNEAEKAYRICAEHSAAARDLRIEAEFHAGWIALRFLHDPAKAMPHFTRAADYAETPISIARAAYWQGRTAEADSRAEVEINAQHFYEIAARQSTTYYGQLARNKLGLPLVAEPAERHAVPAAEQNPALRIIALLQDHDENNLARSLAISAARNLEDPAQMAALGDIVEQQHDAHFSLMIGKLASYHGYFLNHLAYPTYGIPAFDPLPNSAARSLVYAIARQESAFNPNAVSAAGARGVMQMIVPTARRTAQRAGVPFDEGRLLSDPSFNAQLAAAHLGDLLTEQRGSWILTFAAYNAGGSKVKQWIDAYGDPRDPAIDPIDWVERIPFTETRNYVQRLVENLAMYQLRFGEDHHAFGEALLRLDPQNAVRL